uniref:Cnidarian restricted protein n=1 Tax=Clytia hemisphaerica TaxID=252671 RepID=A0A7M5UAS8_9CNID
MAGKLEFSLTILAMFTLCLVDGSDPQSGGIEGESLSPYCLRIKNVTIIMTVAPLDSKMTSEYTGQTIIENIEEEFYLLVKALLREKCTLIWVYSKTHNSLRRITDRNYQSLFAYDFMDVTGLEMQGTFNDPVQLSNLLDNLPESNDKVEQILLYSNQDDIPLQSFPFYVCRTFPTNGGIEKHVSDELEHLQKRKKTKIIVLCISFPTCNLQPHYPLCALSKKWLRKDNIVEVNMKSGEDEFDIFRQTFDLIRSLS